ncbi:poly-gamma-glutamate hydrolase family protein [Pyxidicoccus xibeiensis]|uniref:poly-gamma-glutamate hydrolase family protein n=1 Tax=Pyxidicoccus xibeiensis TaxID=2906759 RepID=UPI0020A6FDB8|nr:poly-gamma-glutamate hydrolase family protein [Pyxidicoccus xibeiensis]MCP3140869.1 poly-gamma-glutamate hydrolase family protein [Pyxidicoccus xibeiensis]
MLTQLGTGVGRQVRVRTGSGATFGEGLCTVTAALDAGTGVVRMHTEGVTRLDMAPDAGVVLTALHGTNNDKAGITYHAPTETEAELNALQAQSPKPNELLERLADDGLNNTLIYTAPHGGSIEMQTAEQVERIAPASTPKVSTWRVKGWYAGTNNAKDHWHITSTDLHEASFPSLGNVLGRDFRYAVSFHGYSDATYPDAGVLVGGREDEVFRQGVAEVITDALRGKNLEVLHVPPKLAGFEPENFVNRLALDGKGLQIEQSNTARVNHWDLIADAVKAHYACLIDTTAEDALTVAGSAQTGSSNGTGYDSTGCKQYAADFTVNARAVPTPYRVSASTSLAGLSQADCTKTEWYLSLYRWSPSKARYHRVGGSRGVGSYQTGSCQPAFKGTYGLVPIQAPSTGAPADQYRAVAWARRHPDSAPYVPLPVSVSVSPAP